MSGRVTHTVIDEIRQRTDIVELIGARVTLKKAGVATFKGCCPFHREKTPSFHVNATRQTYHCFGCGEHGDAFKFLMKQDGLSFIESVRRLADRAGVPLTEETDYHAQARNQLYAIHAELAGFYQRCLNTAGAKTARDYLTSRSLPDTVVADFAIGYAPPKEKKALVQWAQKNNYTPEDLVNAGILAPPNNPQRPDDYYDRFAGRLMFPIRDRQGRVVAFSGRVLDPKSHPAKYVNSPETDIFVKSKVLYALDRAAAKIVQHPRREAIVCEGQIDVIRCHACGFETAVASQGTAFTAEHVSLLKRHADSVVLVFDGDAAGRKAAIRTGGLFLEEEIPVRAVRLPKGEDPDSFLRTQGATPFRELLDAAVSITAYQIETLQQEEQYPEHIDTVKRICNAVLEMLARCPSAVLRARLADEAAALLHMPSSAVMEDLERYREALRQKAETYSERPEHKRTDEAEREEEPAWKYDDAQPVDAVEHADPVYAPEAQVEQPSDVEFKLCEFIVEHEHDPAALKLIDTYLPLDMLCHTFTRTLVEAILQQWKTGEDQLVKVRGRLDPQWHPLLNTVIANKQKMLVAKEFNSIDAAQDLITRIWLVTLERMRKKLDADDLMGLQLSMQQNKLRALPWHAACKLMTLHPAGGAAVTPAAADGEPAAAPYVHAGDSAFGAVDLTEFPPSEYPDDEMLD